MAKIKMYECEACGAINSHKDSYSDEYCYDCVDIMKGELTEKAKKMIKDKQIKLIK